MKKQFLIFIGIAFVIFIGASIHAAVTKINPMDSPFLWVIVGWFGAGLLYFGIWGIKGMIK